MRLSQGRHQRHRGLGVISVGTLRLQCKRNQQHKSERCDGTTKPLAENGMGTVWCAGVDERILSP